MSGSSLFGPLIFASVYAMLFSVTLMIRYLPSGAVIVELGTSEMSLLISTQMLFFYVVYC